MPKKTHGCAGGSRGGLELLLELLRRSVAKRRVQAATIIVLFDERFDVRQVGASALELRRFVKLPAEDAC